MNAINLSEFAKYDKQTQQNILVNKLNELIQALNESSLIYFQDLESLNSCINDFYDDYER